MNKYSFYLIISAIFLFCSCQENPKDNTLGTDSIEFQSFAHTWRAPLCESDTNNCAKVIASYPMVKGSPSGVGKNINDSILEFVKYSISTFHPDAGQKKITIADLVDEFFEEYELFIEDFPDFEMPWSIEIHGKLLYHSDKIVSIEMEEYSFTGGAHPNYNTTLFNFDLISGETIRLEDYIVDQEKLKAIASEKFRKVREIKKGQSFESAGFLFGESFTLPSNFALTEEGLYLFYNPYEVGAYVLGPTAFTIPYEEIESIMVKP
jgi:hypothetical protein